MVDGAWCWKEDGGNCGGIGGRMLNRDGVEIYYFSGPVEAANAAEAEILAILHLIKLIWGKKLFHKQIVICSDSVVAVNALYKGLDCDFPLLLPQPNILNMLNGSVCIKIIPGAINECADSLAKNGMDRPILESFWTNC